MAFQARPFRAPLLALMIAFLAALPLRADDLTALARIVPAGSALRDAGPGIALDLVLSQAVPYRVRLMDLPPRAVLDFREVDFARFDAAMLGQSRRVRELRAGTLRPGWSRLVLELDGPYGVTEAAMQTGGAAGTATIRLRLQPADPADFADRAAQPDSALWALPDQTQPVAPAPGLRPRLVVLDPGHGGIDPGAERDGVRESDLMLTFARELRDALRRTGDFEVVLTRDDDIFVSLEARVRIARQAGADLFLSLHADALPDGGAQGATVYTLSDEATDAASAALAERHDRADLLAGVDLSAQDDLIATVLMSIARTETMPRTDNLADALVAAISETVGGMHRRPRQVAGFSVLKAPDIPSALIELGFMSSPRDLANLRDPAWRARFADALVLALQRWDLADAADAELRRR